MLNSLLMQQYYAFIKSYWNAQYNKSTTNIAVDYAMQCLQILTLQIQNDDTPANQALLDAEATAQQNYITERQAQRAAVATDSDVSNALSAYQQAKAARRAALPTNNVIIAAVANEAQRVFDLFTVQFNKIYAADTTRDKDGNITEKDPAQIAEYRSYVVAAQALRDIAADFSQKITGYVTGLESELDNIDNSGVAPTSYQDIIDASNYTFDGTYSDAVNHISPEGNIYGQITIIQEVDHLFWWAGTNWKEIPLAIDQAATVDLLPSGKAVDTIFRIPQTDSSGNQYYDYYRYDSSTWVKMTQYWDIDGFRNLPNQGYKIGDYHRVIERNVPCFWDGYEPQRIPISVFLNDLPELFLPPGFIAQNAADIQGLVSGQLDHATQIQNLQTQIDAANQDANSLDETIKQISSDGWITATEGQTLKTLVAQLYSTSLPLINNGYTIGLTAQAENYLSDMYALLGLLDNWMTPISITSSDIAFDPNMPILTTHVDSGSYPIAVDLTLRSQILTAIQKAISSQETLTDAIKGVESDAVTNGINVVSQNLVDAFKQADITLDPTWQSKVTNAKVVWESATAIGLDTQQAGKVGAVWVNGELVVDDELGVDAITVHNTDPVIDWSSLTGQLATLAVQPNTQYFIYLANHNSPEFNIGGRDARGKLFLSLTPDTNGYLGLTAPASNARIVGQIDTDSAGLFLREIDISWIAKQASITDTMREVCDFSLKFVDENTVALQLVDGLKGQIYCGGQLLIYGDNVTVTRDMNRLAWINNAPSLDQTAIAANTRYYIYCLDDNMSWNFNAINPATNLPWQESDVNASGNYIAALDKRQDLVLSTQAPEHMVLSGVYPGYCTRYMGSVMTDTNGLFVYSSDISAIRSLQLDPTYLSGLAEIEIQDVSTSMFKIIRKRGTSGILMVGNVGVQTYDADDPRVHAANITDAVYHYSEVDPATPFAETGNTVNYYIGTDIYLYMLNDRAVWGAQANKLIFCDNAPVGGYLSTNYPGNSARWVGTVQAAPGTLGLELVTNGDFHDSNDWDGHTGWGWSSENLNCYHNVGNTLTLDQLAMTVAAGATYQIKFTTSAVGAGSLTPSLGGVLGTPVNTAGSFTQYITATGTNVLSFVPTSDFNGAIDNVSCMQITAGAFTGSYVRDSIAPSTPTIDNTVVGTNVLWDSAKIMQVINDALGVSGTTSVFNAEKTGGLGVRLEYVDNSTVRLIPVSGQDSYIVFPDLSTRTIPAAGITLTVTGNPNVRYYVYLSQSSFYMSTTAPDGLYTKLETLGAANIQVGDICLTSTNAMSGSWNVCSSHNEPSTQWTAQITSGNETISLPGLVCSKHSNVFSDVVFQVTAYAYVDYLNVGSLTATTVGTTSASWNYNFVSGHAYCQYHGTGNIGVTVVTISGTDGLMSSSATYSDSVWMSNTSAVGNDCWAWSINVTARSGSLTITRG